MVDLSAVDHGWRSWMPVTSRAASEFLMGRWYRAVLYLVWMAPFVATLFLVITHPAAILIVPTGMATAYVWISHRIRTTPPDER